jgi:hypothetical protein
MLSQTVASPLPSASLNVKTDSNTALLASTLWGKYTPVPIRTSELRQDIEFQLTGVITLNFPPSPSKAEAHGNQRVVYICTHRKHPSPNLLLREN